METNCIEIWPAEYTYDPKSGCIIDYPLKKAYYLLVTVTLFFVPVIIMALSYSLIVWKLWGHQSPGELMLRQQQTQNRSKKKVSQTRVSTYYLNIIPNTYLNIETLLLNFIYFGFACLSNRFCFYSQYFYLE